MITLCLVPKFNFARGYHESGEYEVILPQNHVVLWSMNCSSLRWAIQDFFCDFTAPLTDFFGADNYNIKLVLDGAAIDSIGKDNPKINMVTLVEKRKKYFLPPWEPPEKDKYNVLSLI